MKAKDLPIYNDPFDGKEVCIVPNPTTPFTETVSNGRRYMFNVAAIAKKYVDRVDDKVSVGRAHASSALAYIQNDPGSLSRAGVITVAGLGGIVAGYKRGIFRKGMYAGLAMTAAAAVCYPNQAMDISRNAYMDVKTRATDLWDPSQTKPVSKMDDSSDVAADEGQSNAADKDMYTTRS